MQVFGGRIVPPDRHPAVAVLDIAQQIPHFLVQLYCDEESHGGSANCARTVSNIILIGLAGNARSLCETSWSCGRPVDDLGLCHWVTTDPLTLSQFSETIISPSPRAACVMPDRIYAIFTTFD